MENTERNGTVMGFFPENENFIVEMKFVCDNNDTAATILDCAMNNKEILPGVIIDKMYRGVETLESVLALKKRQMLNTVFTEIELVTSTIKSANFKEIGKNIIA